VAVYRQRAQNKTAPIDLAAFWACMRMCWFTWASPAERCDAFSKVGISTRIDASSIDRSKFTAVMPEQELIKLSSEQDPKRFEVAEPAEGSPDGTVRQQIRYYKALCEEQQRVIANFKATPQLPSSLLPAPTLPRPKRSREVIEKGCGSHCLSGLRAKQQAKAKIKADAATAAQAKEEAKVAALQAKEDELEEKHTQWMYHNAGRAHCQCAAGKKCFESDTGTHYGHLCKYCGVVKSCVCRTHACVLKRTRESSKSSKKAKTARKR